MSGLKSSNKQTNRRKDEQNLDYRRRHDRLHRRPLAGGARTGRCGARGRGGGHAAGQGTRPAGSHADHWQGRADRRHERLCRYEELGYCDHHGGRGAQTRYEPRRPADDQRGHCGEGRDRDADVFAERVLHCVDQSARHDGVSHIEENWIAAQSRHRAGGHPRLGAHARFRRAGDGCERGKYPVLRVGRPRRRDGSVDASLEHRGYSAP